MSNSLTVIREHLHAVRIATELRGKTGGFNRFSYEDVGDEVNAHALISLSGKV